ncbi:MAG: hypothetical protein IPJ19_04185 [Planctomycetes bacterium]|nr:hypothetical protein [Planctomycetota bacterium]
MNRSIALFVALATLLAHVLAIHSDADGNLAFPYDQAYTAFRLGRNLIQYGYAQWGTDGGGVESYTSLLWIGVAAVGEKFSSYVNLFCQTAAILSGLLAVIALSRFRPNRSAGLIAPLLFVFSGSVAAACGSGMENTLLTLSLLCAFWSIERGWPLRLALSLALLVLARADGCVFAMLLLALGLAPGSKLRGWRLWLPFGVGWAVFLLEALAWKNSSGSAWHPTLRALAEPQSGQAAEGWRSLLDFVRIAPSPLLLVFALLCIVRRKLSPLGWRALLLSAATAGVVVLGGRSPLPFGQAFLPALPFLFLALQESLIEILDARTLVRRAGLIGLFGVLVLSALASKEPGDVGPLHVGGWLRAWMRSGSSARAGYTEPLARAGLIEEIGNTNHLRSAGIFLRDHIDPAATVLSPWPSSIAYLSRMEVTDLLGRTNPLGEAPRGSWIHRERTDVVAALGQQRDYVIPRIDGSGVPPTRAELAAEWAREFDHEGDTPGRIEAIEQAFADYSLITVPLRAFVRGPVQPRMEPFFLLCHKRLLGRPTLLLTVEHAELVLHVSGETHEQLADLSLRAWDKAGTQLWVRPTGDTCERPVVARSDLLLSDTGERHVELMRWRIPAKVTRIEARLLNPGSRGETGFALVGEPVEWSR